MKHRPVAIARLVFVLVLAAAAPRAELLLACTNCGCCRLEEFEPFEPAIAATPPQPATHLANVQPVEEGSWTLAVLPDTQRYAQTWPQHFDAQTQFLVDYAETLNLKYMLHEGDIVNNNNVPQWDNARASLGILDGHVPYALAPGNHDYGPNGNASTRDTLFHNPEYFGPGTPYATQSSIGGFFEQGKTDNSYHTFSAGGNDWLVLALEFGPRDDVVQWANEVVEAHPDHLAMLVTHAYMYFDDTIYDWATKGSSQSWNPYSYGVANQPGGVNDGQDLWENLVSKHANFRFTFNGHVLGDGTGYRSTVGENGNVVHQMLANYQMNSQGGLGDMRLLEFKEDGETVVVRTYSPVLDRYDTRFDQEFTLNMNELRAPPGPPTIPHAVTANLIAVGPTNPSANTVEAVLIPQSSAPGVTHGQINRGDFQIVVDGVGTRYTHGILLASITEHSRPDFQTAQGAPRRAMVEVGRNSFGDGILTLSTMEAGVGNQNEVNFNTSVAWFQFAAGWRGAHVNGNGTLPPGASNGVEPSMVARLAAGRYRVHLDVDSMTDGMLFAIGNNNSNTVVQTGPFADGSGWDVRVQHAGADLAQTGVDRDWSFLYLPYDTAGLVGGYYDGFTESHVESVGDFTMSRLAAGQYELTVPDETPETGVLIMTIAHRATGSNFIAPDDNILTYEASPSGSFLINSYDLPGLGFEDTKFVWAFISFDDPISPGVTMPPIPGDYNGDGTVDHDDYLEWKSQFGMSGDGLSADGNANGVVDAADYTIWRDRLAASAAQAAAVPEPASLWLALGAAAAFAASKRGVRRQ